MLRRSCCFAGREVNQGAQGMMRAMEAEPSQELAEQQYADGLAAFRRGDNSECRRLNEAALATAQQAGSERGMALGCIGLSRADFRDGDYAGGAAHAARADEHALACGAEDLRVTALHMRAELTRAQGKYAEAVPMYERLLAADQASGDDGSLAMEHANLGSVLLQTGDMTAARAHLQRALDLCPAKPGLLPYILLGYAGILARTGKPDAAGQLLGAVEAHLESVGEVLDPAEALELSGHIQEAEASGGDVPAARESGRHMTLEQAQALLA